MPNLRPLTHDEQIAVMARCLEHPDHSPIPRLPLKPAPVPRKDDR